MHAGSMELKNKELDLKREDSMAKSRGKSQELDSRERQTAQRSLADASRSKADRDFADLKDRREMAFELTDLAGEGQGSPVEQAAEREGMAR